METITKRSDSTISVSKTVEVADVVVYNIEDLIREEAAIITELDRVRSLIVKAKAAGVEPAK